MLAKWLKGICLAVAEITGDEYDQQLGTHGLLIHGEHCQDMLLNGACDADWVRLRAALFVNLVAMRSCMNRSRNNLVTLTEENRVLLQRANYLFHCAHNSFFDQSFGFSGMFDAPGLI